MTGLLLTISGAVVLLAAVLVLQSCRPAEFSARAVAAGLIGAWGAGNVGGGAWWTDVAGAVGVAAWIVLALRARRATSMRRTTDWTDLDCVVRER